MLIVNLGTVGTVQVMVIPTHEMLFFYFACFPFSTYMFCTCIYCRSAIIVRHSQCCRLLGMNPTTTPLLPQYPEQYEAAPGRWVAMPPHPVTPDTEWQPPTMAWLPLAAYRSVIPVGERSIAALLSCDERRSINFGYC